MLEPVRKLVAALSQLPGVGRRSAERMAHKLARDQSGLTQDLIRALTEVAEKVRACTQCGSITLIDEDPCSLCASPRRDSRARIPRVDSVRASHTGPGCNRPGGCHRRRIA